MEIEEEVAWLTGEDVDVGLEVVVADVVGGDADVGAGVVGRHVVQRQFVQVRTVLGLERRLARTQHPVPPAVHLLPSIKLGKTR